MELLECASEESDEFVKTFCAAGGDTSDNLFPAFNLTEMLFGNAYAFPGLTLVAGRTPLEQMLEMSVKLCEHFPRASDIESDIKKQEESATKEKKLKDADRENDDRQDD